MSGPVEFNFEGEVCVVTGGTTGIGKATVRALIAANAFRVYNLDISEPDPDDEIYASSSRLISSSSSSSSRAIFMRCDVSNLGRLRECFQLIRDDANNKGGKIHHLISNAGIWHQRERFEDFTEEDFDKVIGVNVKGCFFSVQAALPGLRAAAAEAGGNASVVVTCSDQTHVGKPGQNIYGLSKGAMGQMVKTCAVQFAPENIRVNGVCPGTIDTPLMHGAVAHIARQKVAAAAAAAPAAATVSKQQERKRKREEDEKATPAVAAALSAGELEEAEKEQLYKWLQTAQPIQRLGTPNEVARTILMCCKVGFMSGALINIDGAYTAQ